MTPIFPASSSERSRAAALALLLALSLTGCGKRGRPLPPIPRGPLPPVAVEARQIGPLAVVRFNLGPLRGDRPSQALEWAELVRVPFASDVSPTDDPGVFRRRGEVVATLGRDRLSADARLQMEDRSLGELEGGAAGWTLRYAVRVGDRAGRMSPLVVAADLAPLPYAPPPARLDAESTAEGIRLRWEAPAGWEEATYNVYRAAIGSDWPDLPLNAGPLTESTMLDDDVVIERRYVYWVRIVLDDAKPYREGSSTAPREITAEDRFPPEAPSGLVAVQEGRGVRLFWNPSPELDLSGYGVERRVDGGSWELLVTDEISQPLWLDEDVRIGQRLSYRVTAVDDADPPNRSVQSESVEIEMRSEPPAP